jgi:isoquinoline 1-oxidoreductase alpha subunit
MKTYTLSVNNKTIKVEAEPETPMLWVLRDYVGLKGTKFGCGMGLWERVRFM